MALPTKVTLAYSATATNAAVAALSTALSGVSLAEAETVLFSNLGLALESDGVGTVGKVVTRTLVYSLSPENLSVPAPSFFKLAGNPPGKEDVLAIFSSSGEDFFSANHLVLIPVGAETASVSYRDRTGQAFTTSVNLSGKQPVAIPLAAGSLDFSGGIIDVVITEAGTSGVNQGQLTISVIEGSFALPLPTIGSPGINTRQELTDALQSLLQQPVAMLPNGYQAMDPTFGGGVLSNYFTFTLQKALATPIAAAAPAFS
jgi:hypothetical protein